LYLTLILSDFTTTSINPFSHQLQHPSFITSQPLMIRAITDQDLGESLWEKLLLEQNKLWLWSFMWNVLVSLLNCNCSFTHRNIYFIFEEASLIYIIYPPQILLHIYYMNRPRIYYISKNLLIIYLWKHCND
jgi:hypothetical protein